MLPLYSYERLCLSSTIRASLAKEIEATRQSLGTPFVPGLAIVQVGNRSDSEVYIRQKAKSAKEIGVDAQHVRLPNTCSEQDVQFSLLSVL